MTAGSILLSIALILLVGMVILRPLLTPALRITPLAEREQLLAEKAALLTDIRALEFDLETGKIASAEYEIERTQLVQNAANVLRQIDELPEDEASAEAQIEAAIMALRGKALEAEGWSCSQCQNENSAENQFCGKCGEAQV